MAKMTLDDKLGVDRFKVDEHNAHIIVDETYNNIDEINRLIMACPAGLYSYNDGKVDFNYEGCLECGTCRVVSLGKVIKSWSYPRGPLGVEYHHG
ncbi:MAG: 4Fe-4S dicluster domain-containing protein [Clostridiales Family XIII bacterium]|jgi:ferredoxin like protein|nr:4Fe-4S dicluster domain-containing protein [Clostridiales Family XIII bacterium]